MTDVGNRARAIWVDREGPHVVVTMTRVRALELAESLTRCDVDSADVAELVQLLSQATADRGKFVEAPHQSSFGNLLREGWIATTRSFDAGMARRKTRLSNDDVLAEATSPRHTYALASPYHTLETINPFVVDAWSAATGHGERNPDLPKIHVSATGARTAAILGPRSVSTSEPTGEIHDVSAEFPGDPAAERLKAAARVADVVATEAGQAAIVAIASQFALETATQAREAADESSRAAATAAAASMKFETVVKEAAEARALA